MKRLKGCKLAIIFLIVSHNMVSQTNVYKPFPQGYGYWSVTEQHSITMNFYRYKTSGDTLVGAYIYKKVLYSYSLHNPFNFGPYAFGFGYRNDSINKKVYLLSTAGGLNKDTLWYDFNLTVGDTVKNTYAYEKINVYPYVRVVQYIDSIMICGSYYKQFNFTCTDQASSLVEGIGFLDDFMHTTRGNECPFEPSSVYTTEFSTCNVTTVEEYSQENIIKISPNPANSELKIDISSQVAEYMILNNTGAIILKGNLSGMQSINVSSLASGLYAITIQDGSGKHYQSKFIKQ